MRTLAPRQARSQPPHPAIRLLVLVRHLARLEILLQEGVVGTVGGQRGGGVRTALGERRGHQEVRAGQPRARHVHALGGALRGVVHEVLHAAGGVQKGLGEHLHEVVVAAQHGEDVTASALGVLQVALEERGVAVLVDRVLN